MRAAVALLAVWGVLPVRTAQASPGARTRAGYTDPSCTVRVPAADRAALWAPPLDRLVSLRVSDLTVRDAVDHLAGVARLDLSYSADLLPTTKRVCLALERVPVGAVLDYLLEGSLLSPIVLGSAQVVLAPSRAST
ncbi:hypothetical protein, partial [Gemmatimonas sp.]|uniref:hypothetical protein n=1 Tax=Gemmatimonas sp. TaxID=1962908 RepID=UPI0037C0F0E2